MTTKVPSEEAGITPGKRGVTRITGTFRTDRILAADGTRLAAALAARTAACAFVVAPGFTNHVRKPEVRRVLERLARHGAVLGLDLRGHGRSAGRTTMGVAESTDLAAGVRRMRELGYRHVTTVGFSMGGSVVIRQAATSTETALPDSAVAVSSPARWWVRETAAMRRVHWLLEQPHGRLAARFLGVRLGPPWESVPVSPIELIRRVAPTPLLLVHGARDHYFPVRDAVALHEAREHGVHECGDNSLEGREHRPLWLEPGMRHAESATSTELVDRIARWALATVGYAPDPSELVR